MDIIIIIIIIIIIMQMMMMMMMIRRRITRAMLTWPSPAECVCLLEECICSRGE
jgi:hypothetical protein